MNIAFMGTPPIAKDILKYINENGDENIKLVVTREDKIRGRGKKLIPTHVKEYAMENEIDVLTPKKIDDEFIAEFKKYNIDLVIVVAYGKILPKEFLNIPKYGCINIHFSLLPKYRGASPVESAILNGEDKTGISIINMNEKMDEGDILYEEAFEILENDKTEDVFNKAVEISKKSILNVIKNIKDGKVEYKVQDNTKATYCGKFTKEMAILDFSKDTVYLHNMIRAFSMSLGTKTDILGFNVKIWESRNIKKESQEYINLNKALEKKYKKDIIDLPAKTAIVKAKSLYIKTVDGILEILKIQPENKGKLDISDFINGYINKIDEKNIKIV